MKFRHRIEDMDFYLGIALICFALNAPRCGIIAVGMAFLVWAW